VAALDGSMLYLLIRTAGAIGPEWLDRSPWLPGESWGFWGKALVSVAILAGCLIATVAVSMPLSMKLASSRSIDEENALLPVAFDVLIYFPVIVIACIIYRANPYVVTVVMALGIVKTVADIAVSTIAMVTSE